MTTFWSLYITALTLGTLLALTWLIFATRKGSAAAPPTRPWATPTDGIEEYDNPLPKWWFMLFVGTLVFAVGYLALYPGLGTWKGLMPGYQSADEFADKEKAGPASTSGKRKWPRPTRIRPDLRQVRRDAHRGSRQDPQAVKMGGRLFASTARSATAPTPRAPTASPT